jgi:hypothetical protein
MSTKIKRAFLEIPLDGRVGERHEVVQFPGENMISGDHRLWKLSNGGGWSWFQSVVPTNLGISSFGLLGHVSVYMRLLQVKRALV